MTERYSIEVKHNMEVAHRLFTTPGKCENVHGHSMWVHLEMWGDLDEHGMLEGIDFGAIKAEFRAYMDEDYDHRTLLNHRDWLARPLLTIGDDNQVMQTAATPPLFLPGLAVCKEDPTTENLAKWLGSWGQQYKAIRHIKCTVHETAVNMATWEWEA